METSAHQWTQMKMHEGSDAVMLLHHIRVHLGAFDLIWVHFFFTNPRTHEPTTSRTHEPTNPRTHDLTTSLSKFRADN